MDQYSSIILTGDLSEKAIKEIKKINPKMVLVDARLRFDTIDSVEPDLMTITEKILDQFLLIGRKKIAFIGALNKRLNLNDQPEENWEDSCSVAYRRWTKQHDLPAMIINGDWSAESGYQSIKKLFQDFGKVDALIAASDVISIGAIKYLQEQKITIGKDILLASFDDLSFISYLNPSLTSVDLSPDAIGSTALKQALELADNERDWHKWTIIPGKIVYRDSFNFKNLK
ncbi:substrate-binding domain-containing protein [Oenococcus alcoholitolerans]|uniref:substrate-binding domain-containing protein n=1 Tax=Oenococcus alcoholitolerans TaxID=931074 RepID=UPI003F71EAA7